MTERPLLQVTHTGVDISPDIAAIFNGHRLDALDDHSAQTVRTRETDQRTMLHRTFYEKWPHSVASNRWRNELVPAVAEIVGIPLDELAVQRVPTFRVHLQDNKAIGELHTDADYGHAPPEINVWVPFTRAFESNTVWVMNDAGYLEPQELGPCCALIFDGVQRPHMNMINRTGRTRVSFDFRVAPVAGLEGREPRPSINNQAQLVLGDYFVRWNEL